MDILVKKLTAILSVDHGLTVVPDNAKHFEAMPGIKVVNWIERG